MTPRFLAGLLPVCAALTLLISPAPSFAQAPAPATAAPPSVVLDPAEKKRSDALMAKFNSDVSALRANAKLTPAQKQAQFQTMAAKLNADMLAILTPAQRAVVMKQRVKNANFQLAHRAEIAQGQALAAKLNKSLTPAEQAKMTQITTATRNQLAQVDADTSLSAPAKLAKKQAIVNTAQVQAMAILNPAQQADLKKMQALQKKLATESAAALK